jgi:hypothetical protein
LEWSNTTKIFERSAAKCFLQCGQTKVTITRKTKKVPWHWDEVHQKPFDDVKAVFKKDVALGYPDYSNAFKVTTMPHQYK